MWDKGTGEGDRIEGDLYHGPTLARRNGRYYLFFFFLPAMGLLVVDVWAGGGGLSGRMGFADFIYATRLAR